MILVGQELVANQVGPKALTLSPSPTHSHSSLIPKLWSEIFHACDSQSKILLFSTCGTR
jgi:hypothetical protein